MLPDTLYPKDANILWSIHESEATPAFEEGSPLFDEELRILESEGEFDVEVHTQHRGACLAPAEGGGEILVSAPHVYRDGEARLRY